MQTVQPYQFPASMQELMFLHSLLVHGGKLRRIILEKSKLSDQRLRGHQLPDL